MSYFTSAKPVWIKGMSRELNTTVLFSAEIPLAGQFSLTITACNFYRVFLDGKLTAYGPARAAHGYCRVDKYDLTADHDGSIIVIEAAGYNCRSFYSTEEAPFLQAEIICGNTVIATGCSKTFDCRIFDERVKKVVHFSYQRPFSESYVFGVNPDDIYSSSVKSSVECEIVPERCLLERGVSYPILTAENARFCEYGEFEIDETLSKYGDRAYTDTRLRIFTEDELETCPSDDVSRMKYSLKSSCSFDGTLSSNEYSVCEFDNSLTGFIGTDLTVFEDAWFYVIFEEVDFREDPTSGKPRNILFSRNSTSNIVEYKCRKGDFRHISFEPYTAKFLKIIVRSGKIKVNSLSIVKYENPDVNYPGFSCGNEDIMNILSSAERTFRHNALDVLTDCPSRERAGWLCDSWFTAQSEYLFTGMNKVENNFLENIALSGSLEWVPDGMIPMCYPADFSGENMYIPNWSLWYLLELEDNFRRTGSRQIADISKDKVYRLLDYFRKFENSDGLLEDLEGWFFVEWSAANDPDFVKGVNYPSNMMYSAALKAAGRLYGDADLIQKGEKILGIVREQSFNGEFFEDNRIRVNGELVFAGHITETCQYYAFFCAAASPESHPKLWNTMLNDFGPNRDCPKVYPNVHKSNAFIGNYLRLILITDAGMKEKVLDESVAYFSKMANLTGTLWENDSISGSLDHGFASYIAVIFDRLFRDDKA